MTIFRLLSKHNNTDHKKYVFGLEWVYFALVIWIRFLSLDNQTHGRIIRQNGISEKYVLNKEHWSKQTKYSLSFTHYKTLKNKRMFLKGDSSLHFCLSP